jgi:hypothetical protein
MQDEAPVRAFLLQAAFKDYLPVIGGDECSKTLIKTIGYEEERASAYVQLPGPRITPIRVMRFGVRNESH